MNRRRNEQGSMTGFVAVIATALVLVAGMAYDGGQVIAAHSRARNTAERAARAGAQQIDLEHLRLTGEPRLDPAGAQAAALAYLEQAEATGSASINGASITVTVTHTQTMRILPAPDRIITISETASAIDEVQP